MSELKLLAHFEDTADSKVGGIRSDRRPLYPSCAQDICDSGHTLWTLSQLTESVDQLKPNVFSEDSSLFDNRLL